MRWLLGDPFGKASNIEIEEDNFNKLVRARNVSIILWEIEDSFSLVADSFIELEKEVTNLGIDFFYSILRSEMNESHMDAERGKVNLRLLTLLNAAQSYEHQAKSRVAKLGLVVEGKEFSFSELFSNAYDSSLEYRISYNLRNYAQHNSLPLKGLTFLTSSEHPSGKPFEGGPTRLRITVDPSLVIENLLSDRQLNRKVRAEVAEIGKKYKYIDLKFLIRGYIGRLAGIHNGMTEATNDLLDRCLSDLRSAKELLQEKTGQAPRALHIIHEAKGSPGESFFIDPKHFEFVSKKRGLWKNLVGVQRGYVSSEITRSKETYPDEHGDIWIT